MLAAFLQTPKSFSGHLQRFCELRFLLLGICRSSASSDFSFWAFAGVLQAPISPFGHLQKFCKLRFLLLVICRSSASSDFSFWAFCRSSASSDFSFWAFAEVLQAPFSPFGHLQKFCKRGKEVFGVCNIVASISKSTLAVTALNQRHAPEIR